jgi:hypothetical protein
VAPTAVFKQILKRELHPKILTWNDEGERKVLRNRSRIKDFHIDRRLGIVELNDRTDGQSLDHILS